jgi:hypothetical protein
MAQSGSIFEVAGQRAADRFYEVVSRLPVVVEAVVDPFVPPMPPKVTVEQAAKFGEALLKGTPNRDKIALTVLSDKVKELI